MPNSLLPEKAALLAQARKAFFNLGYIPYLLSCQLAALGISVPKLERSLAQGTWR